MQLPEYKKIKLRNSCDRYGFSCLLSDQLNQKIVPFSFADWIHGWLWDDDPIVEYIVGSSGYHKTMSIIVANQIQRKVLESSGYKNVIEGGLPFAYVPVQGVKPKDGALLAFLPHSSEGEVINAMQLEYLDYLESCVSDFSEIFVSIYWLDNCENLQYQLKKRKLSPVIGARPDDKNSLIRMRRMLEYCPYVTSNTMGSHIAYAFYVGCNVSLTEPYFEYPLETFYDSKNLRLSEKKLHENIAKIQNKNYIKSRFQWFYVDHPMNGLKNIQFGENELGVKWRLTPLQIKKALGWTLERQIYGYSSGIGRRLIRTIKSKVTISPMC